MKRAITMILSYCFLSLLAAHGADPKTNWMNNCVQCHGPDGSENTSMVKALNAKDLTSAAIQSSFTDAQAAAAITDGMKKERIAKVISFSGKTTYQYHTAPACFRPP